MRAVTLRRLTVYGVCLLGVGALHLAPGLANPASAPEASVDDPPPGPVPALELREATPAQLRLVWAPGTDDIGIVRYRVWLNGYEMATTSDTEATLDWFNDDGTQHVVQVQAVDTSGNRSGVPTTLLVTRPTATASTRSTTDLGDRN